jgi:hypothetical protein
VGEVDDILGETGEGCFAVSTEGELDGSRTGREDVSGDWGSIQIEI